jgi:hypothetical protein
MTRRDKVLGLAGSAAVLAAVTAIGLWWYWKPVVIAAAPGDARVLAISRGEIYWADDQCHLWRHPLDDLPGRRPGEEVMKLSACTAHNPIFSGNDFFRLTGGSRVVRHAGGSFGVVAEHPLSRAFAVDGAQVYLGHCALDASCQIVLAADDSDESVVMQGTDITDLKQLAVDGERLFWLDRGKVVRHHGQPPRPPEVVQAPRLMMAPKLPRADESVLVDNFGGERFFLTPRFVLWQSAGRVRRIDKKGGAPDEVLAASALYVVAVDGAAVFLATDTGIWEIADLAAPAPRRRYAGATKGIAVDPRFLYFVPPGDDAIVRLFR